MKKILLLLCTLLSTVGLWATTTVSEYQLGAALTGTDQISESQLYVVRVSGVSYITETTTYEAPNAQNQITDNALFYIINNADGTFSVRCKGTNNYWGAFTDNAIGNWLPSATPTNWTFAFTDDKVTAKSGDYYINRSSGVMHGWASAINYLQIFPVDPVEITCLSSSDELSNNKAYIVNNVRGTWNVADGASQMTTAKAFDIEAASQQFAVINCDGQYYVYSVNAKGFLNPDNTFGDPAAIQIAATGNESYPFFFKFDDTHNVNVNGAGTVLIDTWATVDDGNSNRLIEAVDFDPTEAIKAIKLANLQPGDDLTAFIVNPSFETGDMTGWTTTNSSDTGVKPNSNGTYATNGCDGQYLFNTWWKGNPITQTVTDLPNGKYEMKVLVANDAGEGNNDKPCIYLLANGNHAGPVQGTSKGTFAEGSIEFYVTDGTATIGVVGGNTDGSFREDGYYWYKADNFRLTYVEPLPSIDDIEIPEGKMSIEAQQGIDVAKEAGDVVALIEAVKVAEASIAAYAKAEEAIADARAILEANNMTTSEAYDIFLNEIVRYEDGWEAGNISDEEAANAGRVLGTVVTDWRAGANGAAVKFLESAYQLPNNQFGALYVNTWSVEGYNDGSDFKVPFYENFVGSGETLGENTFTTTVEGLEPGTYQVTALVRVALQGDRPGTPEGIQASVNGGDPVELTDPTLYELANLYLQEITAEGVVGEDGKLTFSIDVLGGTNVHWLSFKNVKYTKLEGPADPYEAALAAIEDGSYYKVFTEVDGTKYYLTGNGTLSAEAAEGPAFKFQKVAGEEYEYGFKLNNSGTFFSNPSGTNESNLKAGKISTSTSGRDTWEAQVWFLNSDGLYAVRSTNAAAATSSWGWVGSSYWYVEGVEAPIAQYQWEPAYVWQLEEIENPVNVTYVVYPAGSTEPVGQATVVQEAGSEPVVPDMLKTKAFYKYVMDEDAYVGEEDVTINVTRDYVDGLVLELAGLNNNTAYTIACDRGALLTNDDHLASQAHGTLVAAEPAQFAVISYEDNFYLYSIADKKFVTFEPNLEDQGERAPLADEPTHGTEDALQLEPKAEPYFLTYFTADGSNFGLNTNGNDPYGYVVNTWMTADAGNQYFFIEAGDFDVTEALAALDAYFHPVEAEVLDGIAQLKAFTLDEDAQSANVTLHLTDAKVTFVGTTEKTDYDEDWNEVTITVDNVMIEDNTAAVLLQGLALNEVLKAGDTVNGDISLTIVAGWFGNEYAVNDLTQESLAALEVAEGEAEPTAITDDNVLEYADNFDSYYVEFADATLTMTEDGAFSINLPVMDDNFDVYDLLEVLADEDYPEEDTPVTARGYIIDYFGVMKFFQPISFEVPEEEVPVVVTGTFDGVIKQILSHPQTGKQGMATSEQTVTIAEGEEEGTYDITFSGFTMPVTGAELPEFTITGVEAEVSEDGTTATYSLPVWAPQTITVGRGTGSVTYKIALEGTKTGEDAPVLKLTLVNSVVDKVYFGADEETVDAAIEEDEATAIRGINGLETTGTIFDLSGRKVEKIQRGGIYIVNGKKVSIK